MNMQARKLALAFASAAMLTLAGCGGGGGGGGGETTAPPIASGNTGVPVTVIDDAIGNATVCLDKNLNGVCDSGEPSGKTDTEGKVTLQVTTADVGKYPILAIIGLDAVDAKYGKVLIPFTMTAPADKTAVISPLTTLVQTLIASTGASSAVAEASVKEQTGINVSLFEDFTKVTSADSQAAGTVARMVVVVTQQQSDSLKATLGSSAIDGAVIKQADLDKVIQNKLLEILPNLLTALADPSVQAAATPELKLAAFLAKALVASASTGLTTGSVATLVAINNQTAPSSTGGSTTAAATPTTSASLRTLTFENAANWFSHVFTATAAQNTPDASGNTKYVDRRNSSSNSAIASWNTGSSPARQSDLHFNGSAWVNCGLNQESISSVRDALGNSTYNSCDNAETGKSNRATFPIAGTTMLNVLTDIRTAGYTNLSIGDNSATTLASALGSTPFPLGSSLSYQASTVLAAAPAYYPGTNNIVQQSNAAVAAGRTTPDVFAACAATVLPPATAASKLEDLVAVNTGTPCINNPGTVLVTTSFGPPTVTGTVSSGARNDDWGSTSLSIGTVGTAAVGGIQTSYYTTNRLLRIAFGAGNSAKYLSCQQRSTDGSARNCDQIGTGTYTITAQGDARILTLSSPPLLASGLNFQRVFVERGGKVYFGYQNKTGTFNSARLNLTATNALFTQLGLPAVDPDTPLALTAYSYAGVWDVLSAAAPNNITRITLPSSGLATCENVENKVVTPFNVVVIPFPCTVTVTNPATGAISFADAGKTATGTFNFLTGAIAATYNDPTATPQTGPLTGARR